MWMYEDWELKIKIGAVSRLHTRRMHKFKKKKSEKKSHTSRCEKLMKIKHGMGKLLFFLIKKGSFYEGERRLYTWKFQRLIPSGIWARDWSCT